MLAGRPSGEVEVLDEVDALYLPLQSRRFTFSQVCVREGQRVQAGQPLARDPGNHAVPLLAPREGTVRLAAAVGHLVLQDIVRTDEEPYHPRQDDLHIPRGMGSVGMKRYKLLALGAWQFLSDAYGGGLPDPFGIPQAVIVSTLRLEPFGTRGDAQLHKRLAAFGRGLEQLGSLLEYQPIYLVLPDIIDLRNANATSHRLVAPDKAAKSDIHGYVRNTNVKKTQFAQQVRESIRGYAWAKLVQVPLRYPFDNFAILARHLGLPKDRDGAIWAMRAEGVLAIDRALTLSQPCTARIVALGGPAVISPGHLKAIPGYPLRSILTDRLCDGEVRIVNGGVLTGEAVASEQIGLDVECHGLTVLTEQTDRQLLGFVRPGYDRRSYSKCFLSSLKHGSPQSLTTGLRGERRPCIGCGFCEEVCPARIMPHLIHKLIYQDELEQIQRARVDLCADCGLCSFVCPSKIDLRGEFFEIRQIIRRELHPHEVEA